MASWVGPPDGRQRWKLLFLGFSYGPSDPYCTVRVQLTALVAFWAFGKLDSFPLNNQILFGLSLPYILLIKLNNQSLHIKTSYFA
jgi:hypothetical protein